MRSRPLDLTDQQGLSPPQAKGTTLLVLGLPVTLLGQEQSGIPVPGISPRRPRLFAEFILSADEGLRVTYISFRLK